jgi:hypothetical protein
MKTLSANDSNTRTIAFTPAVAVDSEQRPKQGKDKTMLINIDTAKATKSISTLAVDSNQELTQRKDKAMPIKEDTTETTDSMPTTLAVDSTPTTPTLKIFKVLVLFNPSQWPNLRVFKIAAHTKTEAKTLAVELMRRLNGEQIEAISADAREAYEKTTPVELVDVSETHHHIPGVAWTSAAIESDDLAGLVEKAEAKKDADNCIIWSFARMRPDEHAAMKRKLVRLAEVGADKPDIDTLEGYALAQYSARCPKRGMVTKLL